MAKFFIERPIFAWVIALFIIVLGCDVDHAVADRPVPAGRTAFHRLVSTTYPGASAQVLEDSVISRSSSSELNGSPGMLYMESVSPGRTVAVRSPSATRPGTNPDLAQVDVQNRLSARFAAFAGGSDTAGRAGRQVAQRHSCCSRSCHRTIRSHRPDRARRLRLAQRACLKSSGCQGRRPGAVVRHRTRRCASGSTRPSCIGYKLCRPADVNSGHSRAERAGVVGHDR